MVRFMLKNDLLVTKEQLEANLLTAMGGRAAEELIFGPDKITQGAASDFNTATKLAYEMINIYGMNDKIGHVCYAESNPTEKTKFMMEAEARGQIEHSYQTAKNILTTHKGQLELLAKALLEYDTLVLSEIEAVIEGKDIKELKAQKKLEEEELQLKEEEQLRYVEPVVPPQQQVKRADWSKITQAK